MSTSTLGSCEVRVVFGLAGSKVGRCGRLLPQAYQSSKFAQANRKEIPTYQRSSADFKKCDLADEAEAGDNGVNGVHFIQS
jgi:hypothetical protein